MQRGLFAATLAALTLAGLGAASAQTVIVESPPVYSWGPGTAYVVPVPAYRAYVVPAPGVVVTAPAPFVGAPEV
jgi:hypothetical protein